MDCQHARLLMLFARRQPSELAVDERKELADHLEQCAECRLLEHKEAVADVAVASVMQAVTVPAGLENRILSQLARQRGPGPWTWTAAAATILLAVGMGSLWYFQPATVLDASNLPLRTVANVSPETVVAWYQERGLDIKTPPEFNLTHLEAHEIVEIQGRDVAKLLFVYRGAGRNYGAVAHVYILPKREFSVDIAEIQALPASNRVEPRNYDEIPEFEFLVVYSGSSLGPFLLGSN